MDTTATIGMTSTPVLIVLLLVLALLLAGLLLSGGGPDRAEAGVPHADVALSDESVGANYHLSFPRLPDVPSPRR